MLSSRRSRTMSRNDSKAFPLPDDFFPDVKLTEEQILNYEMQVEEIVRNALLEYDRHEAKGAYPIYSAPWVPVGSEGPLTAIRKESTEGLTNSEFRLFGCIQGDWRNFINFFYAETSEELFEWNQFMYGYAVDAVVLKNIHTRDSGKPHEYLGLKWTCLQPSSFGRKRDNCFLEYLTYTKDELGRSVGVRVTLPVEIDECPDLYRSLRVKRIKTHNVAIVRPAGSSSEATQLFVMSENDFAGLSVSAKNFKKFMRIYNDMALFVDSKHILKQGMICKTNWMPNNSRKACTNCQLPFNAATRRRSHCRLCGDIFCNHCLIVRNVPRDQNGAPKSRTFQVVKSRFCKACLSRVRRESDTVHLTRSAVACGSSDTSISNGNNVNNDSKKLRKAVSNTSDRSNLGQEWWDDIASESDWSETDSEDASKASLNASGRSRLASSLSSSQSSWTTTCPDDTLDDMSFVATLDVIDDDVAILDEKPQSSKSRLHKKLSYSGRYSMSRRHSTRKQQSQPSVETHEVTEVIDTTDMMTMSELRRQSRARTTGVVAPSRKYSKRRSGRESLLLSSSGPSRRLSRDEPANRFRSSRSISQCLAEQEELLRCMLSVSRVHSNPGVGSKRRVSKPPKVDFAATMPAPRPTVRLYDR
ncbi:FYVE zinc finger domain-containing protein [Phytophthora infestans]|uniref:FYVE zinc finger domain-containing protein n=1 Tax=Phytophthora infestans TaxID=4787 RepID=A0A8S9TWY8_PHYIN|nr:FYVE zinc finger domain-containing protein [Phytophthora infestans]